MSLVDLDLHQDSTDITEQDNESGADETLNLKQLTHPEKLKLRQDLKDNPWLGLTISGIDIVDAFQDTPPKPKRTKEVTFRDPRVVKCRHLHNQGFSMVEICMKTDIDATLLFKWKDRGWFEKGIDYPRKPVVPVVVAETGVSE